MSYLHLSRWHLMATRLYFKNNYSVSPEVVGSYVMPVVVIDVLQQLLMAYVIELNVKRVY